MIEYVGDTLTKLPSDSSDSKIHQSPFPSLAELLNEFIITIKSKLFTKQAYQNE